MKVTGTGSGLPPVETGAAGGADAASEVHATQGQEQVSGSASSAISGAGQAAPSQATQAANHAGRAAEMREMVMDLGTAVKAGRLSPQAAVDALVERVLDQRVGASGGAMPSAVRAQIESALRSTLSEDPFVGAQLAALSRRQG